MRRRKLTAGLSRFEKRLAISRFTVEWLYKLASDEEARISASPDNSVQFSVVELLNEIKANSQSLFKELNDITLEDVEEALLYLSKIGALKLEGGFLVLYNGMVLLDNTLPYFSAYYNE